MSFCPLSDTASSIVRIGEHQVGGDAPCFVIAEAGVNHDGDMNVAFDLIDAAAEAGADAVKFQTFTAEMLVSKSAPKAAYQETTTSSMESHFEMLRRLELSESEHWQLAERAADWGILFLSSPFSVESADLLYRLSVPAYKIPSGEITNPELLMHIASLGEPVILSTGMSDMSETKQAVDWLRNNGANEIVLLHCVSNYPADPADCNLRAMETMSQAFGVPIGFSDHTLGSETALAAVALGAAVIEKHVTLDQKRSGPDHAASMDARNFSEFVKSIRIVESALGHGRKEPISTEADIAAVARRVLVAACNIGAGTIVEERMIVARRLGDGLPPIAKRDIIGRRAVQSIDKGNLLRLEMFA